MSNLPKSFEPGGIITPIKTLRHALIFNDGEWPDYIDPADIVRVEPSRIKGLEDNLHVWWIAYSFPKNNEEGDNEA